MSEPRHCLGCTGRIMHGPYFMTGACPGCPVCVEHARFIREWADRFGFLATKHPRDSRESIDEVACLLEARAQRIAALERVVEATRKAQTFLKNLTFRTGVDVRAGRDGYKIYEQLRDALDAVKGGGDVQDAKN